GGTAAETAPRPARSAHPCRHAAFQLDEVGARLGDEVAGVVELGVLVGDRLELRAAGQQAPEQLELLVEEDGVVIVHEAVAAERTAREVELEAVPERQAVELAVQRPAAPAGQPLACPEV